MVHVRRAKGETWTLLDPEAESLSATSTFAARVKELVRKSTSGSFVSEASASSVPVPLELLGLSDHEELCVLADGRCFFYCRCAIQDLEGWKKDCS